MEDEYLSTFVSNLMLAELAPSIPYKVSILTAERFGRQVLDRFRNDSIQHSWLSITMQYTSKMKMRNLATLLQYYQNFPCVPEYFSVGFAAYLLFMKAELAEDGKYYGTSNGEKYLIQDDKVAYFAEKWTSLSPEELVESVLSDKFLWGTDLTALKGFLLWSKNIYSNDKRRCISTLKIFVRKGEDTLVS
jgi:tagaturonate reductase